MTSWIRRSFVCLFLGAVTTPIVAILCMMSSLDKAGTVQSIMLEPEKYAANVGDRVNFVSTRHIGYEFASLTPIRNHEPLRDISSFERKDPPAWLVDFALQSKFNPQSIQVIRAGRAGWPLFSLQESYVHSLGAKRAFSGPRIWVESDRSTQRQFLPTELAPAGFVGDTVFYALVWMGLSFIPATPGFAIRAVRHKRKRCPDCAYELGQSFSSGCPECGWNRNASK